MMNMGWSIATAMLIFLSGCSGKDAAQSVLAVVPPPAVDNLALGGGDPLQPQKAPNTVPVPSSSESYYGMHTLIFDEVLSGSLEGDSESKVLDFELRPLKPVRFSVNQISGASMGSCPDMAWNLTLFEVTDQGDVVDKRSVVPFENMDAEPGRRYLVRLQVINTSGCGLISASVQFSEEK